MKYQVKLDFKHKEFKHTNIFLHRYMWIPPIPYLLIVHLQPVTFPHEICLSIFTHSNASSTLRILTEILKDNSERVILV